MRHFKIVAALAAVFAAAEASVSSVFKLDRDANVDNFIKHVLSQGHARLRQSKDTGLYTAVSFDFDTKKDAEAAKSFGAAYPSYPLSSKVLSPPNKASRHEKRKAAKWPTGRLLRSQIEDIWRRDLEARGNPMAPSSLSGDMEDDMGKASDHVNWHHHTKRHDSRNGFIDLSRVNNEGADRGTRQLVGGQRPALNPDQDDRMTIFRRDTHKILPVFGDEEAKSSIARRASPGRPPSVHSDEPDMVAAA